MNYCLFASKQGLLFESHALFEGVNIIGMGVNIVRICIMSLEKKYGLERLVAACACASQSRRYGYQEVLDILEHGEDVDFMSSAETESDGVTQSTPAQHKNIRGREYYSNKSNSKKSENGNK